MAKVDKGHFDKDSAYINGLSDGVGMVKTIFEMSIEERMERFGKANISQILDEYDFQQIKDRLETLKKYYIIRGINVDKDGFKKVVVETDRLSFEPDELLINAFLNCHKDKNITFAVAQTIYVRE
jgi:hypothetical protein